MPYNVDIIKKWEQCLVSKDLPGILDTYSVDAVLLGTFAKSIKQGKNELSIYFTRLFKYDKLTVGFQPNFWINNIDENSFILSGIYVFSFVENGKSKRIKARYTFAIKNGKIINHHSSVVPG